MPTRRRSPHVLYVAWGFPPSRGGGVYRALATANAFAEHGFAVTVLTAGRETFTEVTGADVSLEQRIDPRVEVVRVPFPWPDQQMDMRQWPPLRGLAPGVWRHLHLQRTKVAFPEVVYGHWRRPLEAAAEAIHARRPVDLVVGTANPNVDFCAGDLLHRRHGIPYVMDYRDAWMLDVFDGGLLHREGGRVDRLERRLLNAATEVWFVNEPIRAWHARRHPHLAERMHVVANGFDPEFAPAPRLSPSPADRPLTYGYIGTASAKVPLAEFARGWALARSRDAVMSEARARLHGYLGFNSTPLPRYVELLAQYADDGISYAGPVPKSEVPAAYDAFDVALLILGAGRYVTSGKVFEYTATALPVVSVHDPRNAAADVLRGYPLWFPVTDLQPETIARALIDAGTAAREADESIRRACWEFSRRYQRHLQLEPRIKHLQQCVSPGARAGAGATADEAADDAQEARP